MVSEDSKRGGEEMLKGYGRSVNRKIKHELMDFARQMNRSNETKNLIVGLDIGTSKIIAIVAEVKPEGGFEVIGMGSHPSRGLKKGVVVNIETTVSAIQRALEEAELMADCKIREVYTGIAGSHIKSFNSHGMVAIKDKEVSRLDVERVMETAKAVNILNDQQVLHVLNQEFIIDGQEDVREPIGMSGIRLEVKVHIVTGAVSAAQNIIKCVRRCGLEVRDLVLQPLASAMAVLSEDEKDLGVCLVDIGGGTTDIAVFTHGAIRHTAVIPIAGDQITNDIAMALRTPTKDAEDIKCRYGCACAAWPIRTKWLRWRAWAIGESGSFPGRHWRKSSSRALKSSIPWCRPNCVAAVSKNCFHRDRHHRWQQLSARHGGAWRGDISYAGAAGFAALPGEPGGGGAYAAMLHRHWLGSGGHGAASKTPAYQAAREFIQAHSGKDEKLVPGQFLSVLSKGISVQQAKRCEECESEFARNQGAAIRQRIIV